MSTIRLRSRTGKISWTVAVLLFFRDLGFFLIRFATHVDLKYAS